MWRLSEQAQALERQLHVLLSPTSRFGRAKREEGIGLLLHQIKDQGEPAAVCTVARCLFLSSQHVRIIASRTIQRLLSLVTADQLIHLSGMIDWSWGLYVSDSWEKLKPKDVPALLVDPESQAEVLGLLSFHGNGYVRHEAVRRLSRENSGDELPYLLIRQNDWVSVIGNEAQEAVKQRLSPSYLPHFVHCLPLVVHLLAFRRHDLSPIVHKIVELLVQPRHDAMLAEVIRASNPLVRRQVTQVAVDLPGDHQARMIHHGLSSADDMVRLVCAKRLGQSLTGPELRETAIKLQQDRFMPVRREGYRVEVECQPDAALIIWRRALLDEHASIRELAMYSLGTAGAFDAADFYRKYLAEHGVSCPAVSGLAECGDQKDLLTLRSLLAHQLPKFRRAAIRGVARIAGELGVHDLVRSLRDISPSVVGEAKKQLKPFLNDVSGDSLFATVDEAEAEHVRRSGVQLIFEKGKWQGLPWLIRVASHTDEAVASLARRLIEAWFSPPLCNRVFTRPSAAEQKAIDEAMGELRQDNQLLGKLQEWLGAK